MTRGIRELTSVRNRILTKENNIRERIFACNVEEDGENTQIADSPIFEEVSKDSTTFKVFTNFTVQEFLVLFSIVEHDFNNYYLMRRGRKPTIGPKDSFFLMLYFFKVYDKFNIIANVFKIPQSTLESTIKRTIEICHVPLSRRFFRNKPMNQVENKEKYGAVKICGDVVFQKCYRPKRRFGECKHYFSGKYFDYGLKVGFTFIYLQNI